MVVPGPPPTSSLFVELHSGARQRSRQRLDSNSFCSLLLLVCPSVRRSQLPVEPQRPIGNAITVSENGPPGNPHYGRLHDNHCITCPQLPSLLPLPTLLSSQETLVRPSLRLPSTFPTLQLDASSSTLLPAGPVRIWPFWDAFTLEIA